MKVLTTKSCCLWWGKLKKYPMHLSCKNVNSNSVKTIFTGYIESLTLEKLCNRKALEEKSTQVGGQRCDQIKAAPGGSLVNCIATTDFKIKTMALLCDSQQPAILLKKKKKMVMQFLSFGSPPEEMAAEFWPLWGYFYLFHLRAWATLRSAFTVKWVWVPRHLLLGLVGKRE